MDPVAQARAEQQPADRQFGRRVALLWRRMRFPTPVVQSVMRRVRASATARGSSAYAVIDILAGNNTCPGRRNMLLPLITLEESPTSRVARILWAPFDQRR